MDQEKERPDAPPAQGEPFRGDEPSHRAVGIGVQDDGDHYGQDGGRETLTAGEAQRALSDEQAQRLPAMSQNNASEVEKVSGIVAQTRQDVSHLGHDRVVDVLHQRLNDAGISLPDGEVEELAKQVLEGDA